MFSQFVDWVFYSIACVSLVLKSNGAFYTQIHFCFCLVVFVLHTYILGSSKLTSVIIRG